MTFDDWWDENNIKFDSLTLESKPQIESAWNAVSVIMGAENIKLKSTLKCIAGGGVTGCNAEYRELASLALLTTEENWLADLLVDLANEVLCIGDDGLWTGDGADSDISWKWAETLNEIIHGVPRSR